MCLERMWMKKGSIKNKIRHVLFCVWLLWMMNVPKFRLQSGLMNWPFWAVFLCQSHEGRVNCHFRWLWNLNIAFLSQTKCMVSKLQCHVSVVSSECSVDLHKCVVFFRQHPYAQHLLFFFSEIMWILGIRWILPHGMKLFCPEQTFFRVGLSECPCTKSGFFRSSKCPAQWESFQMVSRNMTRECVFAKKLSSTLVCVN